MSRRAWAVIASLFIAVTLGCDGGANSTAFDLAELPDLAPPQLSAGATDGTVTLLSSDISITGAGTSRVGSISISGGAGQIELDGHLVPAAVYQRQSFPNLYLYQTLAVESDRIWVLWLYCSTVDQALSEVYYEATDGTLVASEVATGSCQDTNTTSTVPVKFPAVSLPEPPLLPGFTIDGADISLDGAQPGMVTLGGVSMILLVFNTVDCTKGCGTPGWTELHSLLWEPAAGAVCFAIIHLRSEDTTHVQLAWSLTLPFLTEPAGDTVLPATWTKP